MVGPGTYVGRKQELDVLAAALGNGVTCLIVGDAGMGKSALLQEVATALDVEGARIVHVRGSPALRTIPFGALAAVLPDLSYSATRADVLGAILKNLLSGARGDTVLLAVDDAHDLDHGTAALVALAAADPAIRVVIATRPSEFIASALRDAARVDLGLLNRDESAELVCSFLSGPVDQISQETLWHAAGGHPLCLVELVRTGLAAGTLCQHNGRWRWSGPLTPGERMIELVEGRLATLDTAERGLLEHIAVGSPVSLPVLRGTLEAVRIDETALEHTLVRLERVGLVRFNPGTDSVEVGHPVYGEVIRATLPVLRTRQICRALADSHEALGGNATDPLRAAVWRVAAGDTPHPDLIANAFHAPVVRFDVPTAEMLTEIGARSGRYDLLAERAGVLVITGRSAEAETLLSGLDQSGARHDRDWAHVSLELASLLHFDREKVAEADELLTRRIESVAEGPARQVMMAEHAWLVANGGDLRRAHDLADRLVAVGADLTPEAHAQALATRAICNGQMGRLEAAVADGEEAIVMATGAPRGALAVGKAVIARCIGLGWAGRLDDAERLCRETIDVALALGHSVLLSAGNTVLASTLVPRGRAASALAAAETAEVGLIENDPARILSWCLAAKAESLAMLGKLDEADAALDRADRALSPSHRLGDALVHMTRAFVAAQREDLDAAMAARARALQVCELTGQTVYRARALYLSFRFGLGEQADADELVRLAAAVDGEFVAGAARAASALAAGDPALVEASATSFAQGEVLMLAAELAAMASEMHARNGEPVEQARLAAMANTWGEQCEGAATVPIRRLRQPAAVHSLTARERQIAEKAARGATKNAIAAELFVSPRTVGNHLNHIYAKLGVSTRAELRHLLGLS